MRRTTTTLAGLAGVLATVAAAEPSAQEEDAATIRALREASNAAIAAHDLDALRVSWADDLVVTASSGTVFDGADAMAAAFADSFLDPEFVTYERTPSQIRLAQNKTFASERGNWLGLWNRPDGAMRLRGNYMAQWRRADGEWRLRSEVFVALGCTGSATCDQVMAARDVAKLQTSHWFGDPMLVGAITEADLRETPFDEWFIDGYDEYTPDAEAITSLRESAALAGLEIEAYFGTWCGDSTREIPRLLRSLDSAGVSRDQLSMVALSDQPGVFKFSPARREAERRVHRTPTIVVLRDGLEIGRIVERPAGRLEEDLAAIVAGQPPAARFGAEAAVHDLYEANDAGDLAAPTDEFLEHLTQLGNTESLWHYAFYDLLFNGRPDEAADVLHVFLTLHPDSSRGYRYLAETEVERGNRGAALFAVRRALALDPDNRPAQRLAEQLLDAR